MPSRSSTGASRRSGPWHDDDRFASHAPFHFDLSVFDLFAACRNAATLVLIGENLGKDPGRLGDFMAERRISVWYSAPSILALLAEHGGLDRPGYRRPGWCSSRARSSRSPRSSGCAALWPEAAMWNLYGPTETNVCTAYPIPATIPADRTEPFPIGSVCPPLRARVVDEHGRDVPPGTLGELVIAGPGVMRGYFGQPELTAAAFLVDDDDAAGTAPATWSATTAPAASSSTAAATGWSRNAATGSSSARSSRPSIATTASTAPASSPRPTKWASRSPRSSRSSPTRKGRSSP